MKKSAFICIVTVVVMLNFLLQKNDTLGYFVEDATSSLVVKVTWFGLVCAPLLYLVGTIDKWQNGSYLNQLVRTDKLHRIVISTYFINLFHVLGIVLIGLLINALLTGNTGSIENILNLVGSYMFYTSVYMVLELLFSSTSAVLSLCALLLIVALGKTNLSLLGSITFHRNTSIYQTILTLFMTITIMTFFLKKLNQKDFYGKGI
ncbi:MAG: hypothetical protein ABF754_00175 [Leuconostoc pseudomesenteroides]|uniref:hypothetical protein n=2 Tax=Leuconostoc pseudomesenteroides TaxID=33968 RepID=UPI00166993BA|nr:hypothetical protein [Leuconostoc pseudomesenteroides]MCT4412976.1 hypothetical protein [Leuconostoc pseudomesenteroides]